MEISARALLVNTTVRVWTGEKRDRAITREICTMKGAEDNAAAPTRACSARTFMAYRLPSGPCATR